MKLLNTLKIGTKNMKKKLLFYYELFFAGGTEHSILKIVRKLYQDYEIYIAYDNENTTNIVLDMIKEYAKIINLNTISSIHVDICICCSQKRQIRFSEFSKKVFAKKYLYWAHILLFETYPELEYSQDFMDNIELFICVSEPVKKDIISRYPQLEKKCIIINNYVDKFEIIKRSQEFVNIKIDENSLNIITLSRLSKEKRF